MPYTYNGPSVAATFVTGVFNDAEDRADDLGSDASAEFTAARGQTADIAPALAAQLATSTTFPAPTIDLGSLLDRHAGLDAEGESRAALLAGLVGRVSDFMDEFFPGVEDGVATARAAIVALLQGTNMADGREVAQLRLRQLEARQQRADEPRIDKIVGDAFARGFEVLPGESLFLMGEARRADMQELADASFDIDQAEGGREAGNLERALRLLTDLRARAIEAFAAYLSAALREHYQREAAETGARLAATQQLADRLALQQQATNRAAALQIQGAQRDHQLTRGYLSQLDNLAERQAQAVLSRALAMAKVLSGQAATVYSAFRASAGISAVEDMNDI